MKSFLLPAAHKPRINEADIDRTYRQHRLKVFIGIFIGYAGYYLVRKNFSLAMPELVKEGFSKGDLGLAMSGVAIAYGLSKFLMGSISDRSDARKFLSLGLLISAVITLFMGTKVGLSSIAIMFSLQFLNGWAQGMGWPPCGRVMTHWFSHKERGTKMAIWNVAHNVGGGIIGTYVCRWCSLVWNLAGWRICLSCSHSHCDCSYLLHLGKRYTPVVWTTLH